MERRRLVRPVKPEAESMFGSLTDSDVRTSIRLAKDSMEWKMNRNAVSPMRGIGLSTRLRFATWNCAGPSKNCVKPNPDAIFGDVLDLDQNKAIEITNDREKSGRDLDPHSMWRQ